MTPESINFLTTTQVIINTGTPIPIVNDILEQDAYKSRLG
jgi:hypothetical protein